MFGETDVSIDKFPEYYRSLKEIQRDKQSFNASANIASLASVVLKSTTPRLNRTSSQASSSDKTVTAMEAEFKVSLIIRFIYIYMYIFIAETT